ncbi:MAG: hypothetical protein BGO98_13075 [Myxococcales bacterium 68-20]|nr:VWA domain-containing protein [Myxococcales bacterium]OJY17083.1 MAG: hypothetical protein BGO98_13075 [Myxococcales bacterium 68-20]
MSLRPRVLRLLALLVASTGLAACTLRPEPLRAGWLRSGVYAQPPPPACAPPKAPGVPFEELSRWALPSFDAHVAAQLTLPWVGPFTATVHGAGAEGPRHRVSSRSTQPMRIVDERVVAAQVPGYVAGVDLRSYRRIAFIADTSGWMCDFAKCPDGNTSNNLPPPLLQAMGDQIDAAVAGLRPDQTFVVYAGSAWREIRFAPTSYAGRALAGQFVRGQVCSGARGVRGQLLRAIRGDGPDVVVVLTDGDIQRRRHNDYERVYEECHVAPSYLYCYVDEATELVDMNRIADGARLPPVIAVSVKRHGARWLQNLAEATGGAFVDVAP